MATVRESLTRHSRRKALTQRLTRKRPGQGGSTPASSRQRLTNQFGPWRTGAQAPAPPAAGQDGGYVPYNQRTPDQQGQVRGIGAADYAASAQAQSVKALYELQERNMRAQQGRVPTDYTSGAGQTGGLPRVNANTSGTLPFMASVNDEMTPQRSTPRMQGLDAAAALQGRLTAQGRQYPTGNVAGGLPPAAGGAVATNAGYVTQPPAGSADLLRRRLRLMQGDYPDDAQKAASLTQQANIDPSAVDKYTRGATVGDQPDLTRVYGGQQTAAPRLVGGQVQTDIYGDLDTRLTSHNDGVSQGVKSESPYQADHEAQLQRQIADRIRQRGGADLTGDESIEDLQGISDTQRSAEVDRRKAMRDLFFASKNGDQVRANLAQGTLNRIRDQGRQQGQGAGAPRLRNNLSTAERTEALSRARQIAQGTTLTRFGITEETPLLQIGETMSESIDVLQDTDVNDLRNMLRNLQNTGALEGQQRSWIVEAIINWPGGPGLANDVRQKAAGREERLREQTREWWGGRPRNRAQTVTPQDPNPQDPNPHAPTPW